MKVEIMASDFLIVIIIVLFSFSAFLYVGGGEGGCAASGTSKTEYFC